MQVELAFTSGDDGKLRKLCPHLVEVALKGG